MLQAELPVTALRLKIPCHPSLQEKCIRKQWDLLWEIASLPHTKVIIFLYGLHFTCVVKFSATLNLLIEEGEKRQMIN